MLINLGRLLMLCVWAFLLLNLFHPFPRPLNIFVNVALIFMVLMHGMQMALLKSTLVRPCIRPINVPRMPSEVSRLGMSSASWEWPGLSITLSSLI